MGSRLHFIKNSVSNVMNGLVGALLTLILPHFLVHDFSPPIFSLWILILQLGNFVNIFNFGVALAVSRYVALSIAKGDRTTAEATVIAGVRLLTLTAFLGVVALLALYVVMPSIYHQISTNLLPEARASMLWIGMSFALSLPFSAFSGGLMGLQRNEVPAVINVVGKSFMGLILIISASQTHDLIFVCKLFFCCNLLTGIGQFIGFRMLWSRWPQWLGRSKDPVLRDLVTYCAGLSVWSVTMFFINGMDTAIVGAVDFNFVAAYGLAATFGVFFSGSMNVALNPLVQVFAKYHAHGDEISSIKLMRISSIICSTGLCLAGCWLVALQPALFTLWVGPILAKQAFPFFAILAIANGLRNSTTPYSFYLLGSGQQNKVILTPICEALTNFLFSLILSRFFAALGVSFGALIGAIVCVTANFVYNFKLTMPIGFSVLSMFWVSFALPILWSIPPILIIILFWHSSLIGVFLVLLTAASVFTSLLAFRFVIKHGDQNVAPVKAFH